MPTSDAASEVAETLGPRLTRNEIFPEPIFLLNYTLASAQLFDNMASSPPPLDSIVGAFLIATCADLFLLGIIVIQAYTFYTKTDCKINPYTWSLVTFLVVLDFVSSAFSIAEIYEFAVTGFGDYENLSQLPVAYGVQVSLDNRIIYTITDFITSHLGLCSSQLEDYPRSLFNYFSLIVSGN